MLSICVVTIFSRFSTTTKSSTSSLLNNKCRKKRRWYVVGSCEIHFVPPDKADEQGVETTVYLTTTTGRSPKKVGEEKKE